MAAELIRDPDRLRAVIDAILSIEADAELAELLREIASQATLLVGARYGALGVLSADGTQLSEFVTVGIDDERRAAIGHFPIGLGILHQVIATPEALRLDDLTASPQRAGFPEHHPAMTSFLGVPVRLRKGSVFGNLYLCDKLDGTTFTAEDEELVATLGRAAGLVIDKARLRKRAAELSIAEERQRMARDLHDSVIQRLFAVGLSLQGLARSEVSAEVSAKLNTAIDDLDETIREIRSTIFAISTPHLTGDDGLRRRILDICDEAGGRLGLDVTVELSGLLDEAVGDEARADLEAVVREALTNVVRHADASRAWVNVTVLEGGLTLEVRDDGRGHEPSLLAAGRGLGNLAQRAHARGGWSELTSSPHGGTQLRWHINRLG